MEYSDIKDKYVDKCPYCGNESFIEIKPDANKFYLAHKNFKQTKMVYVICKNCGSVVRSYFSSESVSENETKGAEKL